MNLQSELRELSQDREWDALQQLIQTVQNAGGRAVLVGGAVRDLRLRIPVFDFDVEVYGIDADAIESVLSKDFHFDVSGRSFGVLKLRGCAIDVALPRRESKSGLGHRGFLVASDPDLRFEDAAYRRDFTINAMGLDLHTWELLDPYGGQQDLDQRLLRPVSKAFEEDPLRVYRAMQFLARFELEASEDLVERCRLMQPEGLAPERIYQEWRKLLLKGRKPSRGLRFLRKIGWLRFWPELEALIGVEQDSRWHPEGDVWVHSLHCVDAFADTRSGDETEDWIVGLAVLCHDLGKPATTKFQNGRWRAIGHEPAGVAPAKTLLQKMAVSPKTIEHVAPLIREHLKPLQLHKDQSGDAAIRRLSVRVGRIDRLCQVVQADLSGRPPLEYDDGPVAWLKDRAQKLGVWDSPPIALLQGKDLIAHGVPAGPSMGKWLSALYDAQIEGKFDEAHKGLKLLDKWLCHASHPDTVIDDEDFEDTKKG